VTSPDFESGAYTNFATPAFGTEIINVEGGLGKRRSRSSRQVLEPEVTIEMINENDQ
jgi:hypothetical protein